jgi:hypothetical protein
LYIVLNHALTNHNVIHMMPNNDSLCPTTNVFSTPYQSQCDSHDRDCPARENDDGKVAAQRRCRAGSRSPARGIKRKVTYTPRRSPRRRRQVVFRNRAAKQGPGRNQLAGDAARWRLKAGREMPRSGHEAFMRGRLCTQHGVMQVRVNPPFPRRWYLQSRPKKPR